MCYIPRIGINVRDILRKRAAVAELGGGNKRACFVFALEIHLGRKICMKRRKWKMLD